MQKASIAHLRREYRTRGLTEVNAGRDPLSLFNRWFKESLKARALDANAMTLSTINPSGQPSSRMVLVKGLDSKGFVFFTNYLSDKGKDLTHRPAASLLFFWPQLGRQIRVDGKVQKITVKESDSYFRTRPRGSQLSAWASDQSRVIKNREVLEIRMEELKEKYHGQTIPRPPHWGGFRVIPRQIEFWKGRPNRLHDRLRYRRFPAGGWKIERLSP